MALRGQKWGGGTEFGLASCVYRFAGLSGSQEGVLGQSQRAWLPGVQKEASTVPGCRSQASDSGTKWEDWEPAKPIHQNAKLVGTEEARSEGSVQAKESWGKMREAVTRSGGCATNVEEFSWSWSVSHALDRLEIGSETHQPSPSKQLCICSWHSYLQKHIALISLIMYSERKFWFFWSRVSCKIKLGLPNIAPVTTSHQQAWVWVHTCSTFLHCQWWSRWDTILSQFCYWIMGLLIFFLEPRLFILF